MVQSINTKIEALTANHPRVIDLSLARMEGALAAVGSPHLQLPPTIHIAGTNGKGSTAAYARAMLEAAGQRVHVYTSPHLVRYNERIRLAGTLVDDETLLATLQEAMETCTAIPLTIFELLTLVGFMLFARTPADVLLLEVGLGGRLDATNVITPKVSVITAVSIDHVQFLGETLGEIAQEKAGIIKPKIPVVVGRQEEDVMAVIERIAARNKAPLLRLGDEFGAGIEENRFVYQTDTMLLDCASPKLLGLHQVDNAGCAIAAVNVLMEDALTNAQIEHGLTHVQWPARMQRLKTGHLVDKFPKGAEIWLDGGHNPAAGEVLAAVLADLDERNSKPIILIVGMLTTKDPSGFFEAFEGLVQQVYTVAIPNAPAAFEALELAECAQYAGVRAAAMPSFAQAVLAAAQTQNARVVICGSLYLAGYVLAENGTSIL